MNRHAVVFPIKSYSERVPGKNFVMINGSPLYSIFTRTVLDTRLFDVYIDTDSDEIKLWASEQGINVIDRIPSHTLDSVNGNILLRRHVSLLPGYDYYWQGFVTTPCVTSESVRQMVSFLEEGTHDSVMTVESSIGFHWHPEGYPLGYRPDVMPRSQDAIPIYKEKHGLFGIKSQSFQVTMNRTGSRPGFFVLGESELADIDWPKDLEDLG